MRLVLDTNVLVTALIKRGTSSELLEHFVLSHTIISSKYILGEFSNVLSKKIKLDLKARITL